MSDQNTQNLAEKIAELIQNESQSNDFASLQASIEKINKRLDNIENYLSSENPQSAIRHPQSVHPSLEKYNVIEALVDEILENQQQTEKACTFEPHGKPCDHCSMCSSHGF